MSPEDRDQANAALLLDEKIRERIMETLVDAVSTTPVQQLPLFPDGDRFVHTLMAHPQVKTAIYVLAAETARMLIKQAFQEFSNRAFAPIPTYYTGISSQPVGYVYSADALTKQNFF